MNYVPADWYTNAYPHVQTSHKVRWWKRLTCCSCGISGFTANELWTRHVQAEQQIAQQMQQISKAKNARLRKLIDEEKSKMPMPKVGLRPTNDDSGTLNYWN